MSDTKNKVFYTWDDLAADIQTILDKLPYYNDRFNNIFGIPRGGLVLATMLSYRLDKPLITNAAEITPQTLVCDDIADTGTTLLSLLLNTDKLPLVVTLFYKETSLFCPNVYVHKTKDWIVFPWETLETSKYDRS